nr:uncharacterized mitochondrial protein AtMg00810-like [Tanacetum cinerariifolium]
MEDEEVAAVDGVFEGAFGALGDSACLLDGLEMEDLVDAMEVKQKKDGIFISQDKYATKLLKKFRFTEVNTTSTPMETQKPLIKDEDGEEVDVHMYRFLKGQSKLGLWYPKDSSFDLVAYTDSDYAGASLDMKSTIGDGKEIIITESSVRRDLRLANEEGVDCLPNSTIFEQLTLMGVLDLEKTKTSHLNEIASLKRRVKKLEKKNGSRTHRLKRLYKVGLTARVESFGNEESLGEDASKQERINAIDADEQITLVNVQDDADKEMFDMNVLDGEEVFFVEQEVVEDVKDEVNVVEEVVEVINTTKLIIDAAQVSAAGDIVSTASTPVSVASAVTTVNVATTTTAIITTIGNITLAQALEEIKSTKPKEKGINIQELDAMKPTKRKDQIRLDEEAALKLQDAFDEEERLAREKEKRRNHFAAKRAEEKRNKPPPKAQQRKIMCAYLKNMEGYKLKDLKSKEFDSIQEMFDRSFKRVNTFEDFRTELVEGKRKESKKRADTRDCKEAKAGFSVAHELQRKYVVFTTASTNKKDSYGLDHEFEMAREGFEILRFICGLDSKTRDKHIGDLDMMEDEAENSSPQSTPHVLLSFEVYTPHVTYPEEVEDTIGIQIEVEPLDNIKLEYLALNTYSHDLFLSSRKIPSVDKLERLLLSNFSSLDVSLARTRLGSFLGLYILNGTEKDSEIYKSKKERAKSIVLKATKESSDDETLTSGSDDEEYAMDVRKFKKLFRRKDEFEMSMMGELKFFFGLPIKQMEDEIIFNQSKYIKKMSKKFGLEDSKQTKTPMSMEINLTKDDEADFVDSSKYREYLPRIHRMRRIDEDLRESYHSLEKCLFHDGSNFFGPKHDLIKNNITIPRTTQTQLQRSPNKLYIDDIRPDLKGWELFFRENFFCSLGKKNKEVINKRDGPMPFSMLLTRLYNHIVQTNPQTNVPIARFTFHEHVMEPLDISRNPSKEKERILPLPRLPPLHLHRLMTMKHHPFSSSMMNYPTVRILGMFKCLNRYFGTNTKELVDIVKKTLEFGARGVEYGEEISCVEAKKESSDNDSSTSESKDEEYAMAVKEFKKFFKRRGRFVRQPRDKRKSLQSSRDDKNGKSERKCFRCGDSNNLIGECLKSSRNNNQIAFIGGAWSDSGKDEEEKN